MTTLVGWTGVQGDGPSSIYLASDSRISWKAGKQKWDAGRKLFAFRNSPDLLGYCGDALLPSHMLSQLCEIADHGLLFPPESSAAERHERLFNVLKASLDLSDEAVRRDFSVVHVSREEKDKSVHFFVWRLDCKSGRLRKVAFEEINPTTETSSRRLFALGSGARAYLEEALNWEASAQAHTSRGYFTALCDLLAADADPMSGGAPQLIGLYRNGTGKVFGLVSSGRYYFHGVPLPPGINGTSIEWRDETFQIIDWRTGEIKKGAQRQVRPFRD